MTVIDFHVHVALKGHYHDEIANFLKDLDSSYFKRYKDLEDPHRFASYLASQEVEKAVILADSSPITCGIVPNEFTLEYCREVEVFMPFVALNPYLVANLAKEFERLIKLGARGLKLCPSYNLFYPNDSILYPLYGLAQESRLPVLVHTGSSVFKGARIKYADPIYIDDVAVDFPNLCILMAHSGRGFWYDKAFYLSKLHENVYMEISGLPPQNLLDYFPHLENNIDKVVFGSDWPAVQNIEQNIKKIRALPIAEDSKKKILSENAKRILGLNMPVT
jgi:predicted TIM-barrel fold metal-dependent hydrolase